MYLVVDFTRLSTAVDHYSRPIRASIARQRADRGMSCSQKAEKQLSDSIKSITSGAFKLAESFLGNLDFEQILLYKFLQMEGISI